MAPKIIGAAIIIAIVLGIIFLVKFMPVYMGNSDLERAFSECISNYKRYQVPGCRRYFAKIIKDNALELDPASIRIQCRVGDPKSFVEGVYDQKIDFFGVYTYTHHFYIRKQGRVPDRD